MELEMVQEVLLKQKEEILYLCFQEPFLYPVAYLFQVASLSLVAYLFQAASPFLVAFLCLVLLS